MSSTQMATTVNQKFAMAVLPVSDVDRAKNFYQGLGWRIDGDFNDGEGLAGGADDTSRLGMSVIFGKGFTAAAPGSVQGNFLVVDNIDGGTRRAHQPRRRGERCVPFRGRPPGGSRPKGRAPGRDAQDARSSRASLKDPDGNSWLGRKTRLTGRGLSNFDVPTLTDAPSRDRRASRSVQSRPRRSTTGRIPYTAYIVTPRKERLRRRRAKAAALHMESAQGASPQLT